jgi:hypothetical protein
MWPDVYIRVSVEDTFLFLDALEADINLIENNNPQWCLEIGYVPILCARTLQFRLVCTNMPP